MCTCGRTALCSRVHSARLSRSHHTRTARQFFGAVNRACRFERLPGPARAWARVGNWPCWGKRRRRKAWGEALAPPVDAVWQSVWSGRDSGLMHVDNEVEKCISEVRNTTCDTGWFLKTGQHLLCRFYLTGFPSCRLATKFFTLSSG